MCVFDYKIEGDVPYRTKNKIQADGIEKNLASKAILHSRATSCLPINQRSHCIKEKGCTEVQLNCSVCPSVEITPTSERITCNGTSGTFWMVGIEIIRNWCIQKNILKS